MNKTHSMRLLAESSALALRPADAIFSMGAPVPGQTFYVTNNQTRNLTVHCDGRSLTLVPGESREFAGALRDF